MKKEIIISVAELSRLWLRFVSSELKIKNHEIFLETLKNRPRGPLLTVSNHISTLDDPLIWGALLSRDDLFGLLKAGQMRWTVGARELTFTNPLTSWFFGHGQVIPIVRGGGIYQPAMTHALNILNTDRWLHFFPQGRVIQHSQQIGRLKWGVGRLLMDCDKNVTVLPMILKGFDRMKPNDQLPRINNKLEIIFGNPVDSFHILRSHENEKNESVKRVMVTKSIQDLLNETICETK